MLLESLREVNPKEFILKPIKEALVDTKGLSLSQRILIYAGYIILFSLLILTLVLEVFGQNLSGITFMTTNDIWNISYVAVLVSSGGFIIGWTYVLTGATDFRRRAFLPIMGLFAIQLLFLTPIGGPLTVAVFCFAGLFLLGLVGLHLFTHSSRYWRDFPIIEFGLILSGLLVSMIGMWFLNETDTNTALSLNGAFSVLFLILILFWFTSGLTLINGATRLARRIVIILRYLFTEPILHAIVVLVVLVRPVGTIMGVILTPTGNVQLGTALLLDICISVPLPFLLLIFAVTKRWTSAHLLPLLAISLATPFFTLGMSIALFSNVDVTDRVELALEGVGLLPPLLLFVGLMSYNVLSAGTAFANEEGQYTPRSGRVLVLFGVAILITSATLFFVNMQNPDTGEPNLTIQSLTNNAFVLGLFIFSLPYIVWLGWKRRERLVGEDDTFLNIEPLLHQVEGLVPHKQAWLIIAVVLAGLCACSICSVGMLLTN